MRPHRLRVAHGAADTQGQRLRAPAELERRAEEGCAARPEAGERRAVEPAEPLETGEAARGLEHALGETRARIGRAARPEHEREKLGVRARPSTRGEETLAHPEPPRAGPRAVAVHRAIRAADAGWGDA